MKEENNPIEENLDKKNMLSINNEIIERIDKLGKAIGTTKFSYKKDIFKLISKLLTGWTTVAFVFLFLFYIPIKEVISSIPIKLKSANEISVGGLTIKESIVKEAVKIGNFDLSKSIPLLTREALEVLLKISEDPVLLWKYSPALYTKNKFKALWLPNDDYLNSIKELSKNNMIVIKKETSEIINYNQIKKEIDDIQKKHKGKKRNEEYENRFLYILSKPILRTSVNSLTFSLTNKGKQAKKVIINAVINELKNDK